MGITSRVKIISYECWSFLPGLKALRSIDPMKRKRIVQGRKICERKRRLPDFVESLRKRFRELQREEEEFRIVALKTFRSPPGKDIRRM